MIDRRTLFTLMVAGIMYALNVSGGEDVSYKSFKQDVAKIQAVREGKKLPALEGLAAEVESKWSKGGEDDYARMMLELADAFSSGDFGDKRQFGLADKYARLGLAHD